MANPPNPADRSAPKDEPRSDRDRDRDAPRQGQDRSRAGTGPNNPLPGEPGGPSTAGYSEEDRKAAEEGQRRDRDDKARDTREGGDRTAGNQPSKR